MFGLFRKRTDIDTTKVIDEIESAVFAHIKPYGFKQYGRTLHRFVSEDISQIIHFQNGLRGLNGFFCVNLGIRIPECTERAFHFQGEMKKYYHEYECSIRSRLGTIRGKRETWYDLRKNAGKTINSILHEIDELVLPAFEALNSREAILLHRNDYPFFHTYGSELLDECMIWGHLGNLEKAKELFELHYQSAVDEYNDRIQNGQRQYLKKGERVCYMGQDITAERDGFVTLFGAPRKHLDYLDELAEKLGLKSNS